MSGARLAGMRKLIIALGLLVASIAPAVPASEVAAYSHCSVQLSGSDNMLGRCHNPKPGDRRFYISGMCQTGTGMFRTYGTVAQGYGTSVARCYHSPGFTTFGWRVHFL